MKRSATKKSSKAGPVKKADGKGTSKGKKPGKKTAGKSPAAADAPTDKDAAMADGDRGVMVHCLSRSRTFGLMEWPGGPYRNRRQLRFCLQVRSGCWLTLGESESVCQVEN